MKEVRIDRLLGNLGYGSRSEISRKAKNGLLLINGKPEKKSDRKVDPEKDEIQYDGQKIRYSEYEYWVLNKPAGIISATTDPRRETVISYMGLTRKDMVPCGRLDIDTEGLLLVTDNGGLVHRLLSPQHHVDKIYEVLYDGILPDDAAERMEKGLVLSDGTVCLPAELMSRDDPALLRIHEGKFHQVKRMFEELGCPVTKLRRLTMGPLDIDVLNIPKGEFRRLTEEEEKLLTSFETRTAEKKLNEYKGVIFDLDGTLIDSMGVWGQIDIDYLGRFGITPPKGLQSRIAGMSFLETAEYFKANFGIEDSIETILSTWEEMSIEAYEKTIDLKPGAIDILRYLKEQGIPAAIATSNGKRMVEAFLTTRGLKDYFSAVITSECVTRGKPNPDVYLIAAESLKVDPSDCLVLEDIPEGILAGRRAGMTVISVKDRFSVPKEAEKRRLSQKLIRDFRELIPEN